ncbi:hypothetical protein pdam_00023755, partial [Pocillopora damicornis]
MAQDVSTENVHLQQEEGAEDIMDIKGEGCLQQNNPHQHRNFIQSLSLLKSAVNKGRKKLEGGAEDSPLRDVLKTKEDEKNLENQLLRALGENNASICWELLKRNHDTVRSEYKKFQDDCNEANKKEQQREGRFHCDCRNCCTKIKNFYRDCCTKMSNFLRNNCKCCCCSNPEPQGSEEDSINDETKLKWIKILSNPLFIGLEWLWRTGPHCQCKSCKEDTKLDGKEKKKKEDVIESSLHDAYLLDETSSLKHYNSRDVYRESAEAYETFAAGVLEKASQNELYQIMDIKGEGCLLKNNPNQHRSFIQSLSLLKSAVNKGRKKFVSSPRCQAILDAIIFYKMRDWQDKSMAKKFFWSLLQFVVILLVTPIYVIVRPFMKTCCRCLEELYEHPYNKFANHISFYIVFLGLLFASTFGFEHDPRCQAILDEIIFYKMRDWQDKSKTKKFFWSLWHFLIWRSLSDFECLAYVEKLYEYPYNKFANHTMFYIVFLCLLFASTFGFEHEYRTSTTGLSSIDYAVLFFLVGFLLQEIWEVAKQGFRIYISKWWNVVDTMTLFTLLAAYIVWLVTWLSVYKEWQPRKNAFIVADVLYASATVLAFFHLAHAFQVSSTLGPLQLSLYRMLKDVAKFLFIFLMLFIAFATGLIKIYSYYVVSQVKLREEGESQFQDFHPYAEHGITFIGLFWLLLGNVEEDKIRVDDPAFSLTQLFGRLCILIYVVCTAIVALNMLIAMMNNSFDRVMSDEDKEWKFSRAQIWLEYIDKGNAIPVPFNLVYYTSFVLIFIIGNLVCWIATACCGCKCNKKINKEQGSEDQ